MSIQFPQTGNPPHANKAPQTRGGLIIEPKAQLLPPDTYTPSTVRFGARIHDAAKAGNVNDLHDFLSEGDNVNAVDGKGRTALHRAAKHRYTRAVDLLLKNDADVNICDNKGQTALHKAAKSLSRESCRALVQAGANADAVDNDGRTPRQIGNQLDWAQLSS